MKAKHTPGFVVHDTRGHPHADVRSARGRKIASTWGMGNPKTKEAYERRTAEDRENARRIVACWNLCVEHSTEEIEAAVAAATGESHGM